MKIAILSDSHDALENLGKAIDYLNKEKITEMLFCGDFCSPIPVKKQYARYEGTINAVFGNTEDRFIITKLANTEFKHIIIHGESAELEIDGIKIAMTHYPEYAEGFAATGKYDLVVHGHTHEAREMQVGDTLLVNPGEIMGFNEEARFVVYDTETRKPETVFVKDI